MESSSRWGALGRRLGGSVGALIKPIIWGVLVGGTHLGVMPEASTIRVIVLVALTTAATDAPTGGRFLDRSDRDRMVRLGVVTGIAVAANGLGIRPSAYLVGSVFFVASKVIKGRPPQVAAVAASLVALLAAGQLQQPSLLLVSGDPWSVGGAIRDLLRFAMLLVLVIGARDDERRSAEVEQAASDAVREERTRIARDLHDVVAHHVSVMTIQAEAARSQLPAGAVAAEGAIGAAAESGRTAMTELRRLLGVLRSDSASAADGLTPQPDVDDLEQLLADARATGTSVTFTVDGERPPLSAGVMLSAFRIVQEAVTNALRHAPGAPIAVRLAYSPSVVEVTVENGPSRRTAAPPSTSAGHGLVGMRERAALHEGSVEAGPAPEGGWRIRATLVLDPVRS